VKDQDRTVRAVLAALARGVLGETYGPEVPPRIVEVLNRLPSPDARDRLLRIFRLMDTKAGALALTGRPVPVSWLTPREAEELLQRWKQSRVRATRDLAGAVLASAMVAAYGHPGPRWEAIGYPGPIHPPSSKPQKLDVVEPRSDLFFRCDVVVVGSGAGGGCVAGELARAGLDVVVIEKGGYFGEADFTQIESEANRDLYLYGGTLATADLGIRLYAGGTLGGGTVVNWSTSWRTPSEVLEEWARVSGIDAFADGGIDRSLDAVCERLSVGFEESKPFRRDELLEEGLEKLEWHAGAMPRNVKGCTQDEACGFCTYGCRVGAKQSSLNTYLEDAAAAGARIIVNADARRVVIEDGRASAVEAFADGHRVLVKARAVIVAGGSIETPALLLRSGLQGPVGHNLSLHPATAVVGFFDEEVRVWGGAMQARYSNHLTGGITGGYGPTLETGPAHPGGTAALLPWLGAAHHKGLMDRYAHLSPVGFPLRERGRGRVRIDRRGNPRAEYVLAPEDERTMAEGIIACGKVLETAGAREIYSLHREGCSYRPGTPGAHETWADEVRAKRVIGGACAMFSMHQMGSCRMGVDEQDSVVGPDNESHEVRDLFVVDASTFPTPSGVNPMISIYGIAHRAATKLAERLT
jgi:long-chain-alcohol oxidase